MTSDRVDLGRVGLWLAIGCILLAGIACGWNPTPAAQLLAAVFIACALLHAVASYGRRIGLAFGSHFSRANLLWHLSLASADSECHGQLWCRVAMPSAVRTAVVDRFRNLVLRLYRAILLAPPALFLPTAVIAAAGALP
jgi:hypothetical protein